VPIVASSESNVWNSSSASAGL